MARNPGGFILIPLFFFAAIVTLGSFLGTANPIVWPIDSEDSTFYVNGALYSVAFLVLLNFLVDLSLLSCFFLVFTHLDEGVAEKVRFKKGGLFAAFLLVGVIVAVVGAVVDYTLVTVPVHRIVHHGTYIFSEDARAISPDVVAWGLAVVAIFLSVWIPSVLILRMPKLTGLALGESIAVVNPLWWLATWEIGADIPLMTLVISILTAPILCWGIVSWDRRRRHLWEPSGLRPDRPFSADGGQSYRGALLSRLDDAPSGRGRGKA